MKFIQIFNRYLAPGGEEKSAARIGNHLARGNHKVIRFWKSSAEWTGPSAPPKYRQLFSMWRNAPVLRELAQVHAQERPHAWILHNVATVVSLGVYGLARRLKVPVIQWLHNYRPISPSGTLKAGDEMLRPDDRWIAWKETLAGSWRGRFLTAWLSLGYAIIRSRGDFESVRAWIAVSDEMKNIFQQAGFPRSRLFTLRHGWDSQPPSASGPDQGYFLYLGRMIEAKGVRFLVDLWRDPALKQCQLAMAGDGPLCDALRPHTPQNIRWLGYLEGEEKRRWIAGCRAILFPSLWPEPLSTVAYEAYEMSKPVISSSAGGMKEIIVDGETGRLLLPGDNAAWVEVISQLHRDAALARRLGESGRAWLDRNVSISIWNEQFNDILQRVGISEKESPHSATQTA